MKPDNTLSNRIAFSSRFKQLREEKAMSQDDFSKFLGISRVSITYYERADQDNGRLPDAINLIRICNKCNCSADYLLGFTNDRNGMADTFNETDSISALKHTGFTTSNARQLFRWRNNPSESDKLLTLNILLSAGIDSFLSAVLDYFDTQFDVEHGGPAFDDSFDFQSIQRALANEKYAALPVEDKAAYIRDSKIPNSWRGVLEKAYYCYSRAFEHVGTDSADEISDLIQVLNPGTITG